MKVKKIPPQDRWQSELAMAVAFESEFDWEKEKAKEVKETSEADWWGAYTDDGKIAASIIMNNYNVRFDGNVVKMGGVGGVATLPEYRRGGAIRSCMEASFRSLYDNGFAFSALYPFSSAYYRKFGFEDGELYHAWELEVKSLNMPEAGGRVRQLFPGDDLSPLLKVYNMFNKDCNMSVIRDVYDKDLEKGDMLEKKKYIFLWEDDQGEPGAFLIGSREGDSLNCMNDFGMRNGLLYSDARSLCGLLNFVRTSFIANYKSIKFTTPSWADVFPMLPEHTAIKGKLLVNGMMRVVNVEQVLGLCRCEGEGEIVLQVEDPILEENRGCFLLSFSPEGDNLVERTDREPDISLSVGHLAALLCGSRSTWDLPWMPGVKIHRDSGIYDKVFPKKRCLMMNLF